MALAEQYRELVSRLPADWADARFLLQVDESSRAGRAAAVLTPFSPGRVGSEVRFTVPRSGGRVEQAERMLARLDREGVTGTLELVTSSSSAPEVQAPADARAEWPSAADAWGAAVAALPEDWSDVYAQADIGSSDFLDRAALLMAPLNPARYDASAGFRFRVARRQGYGASPEMARRAFERLDEEGIAARVQILRALSDTRPVLTQGPVWYVGGRSV